MGMLLPLPFHERPTATRDVMPSLPPRTPGAFGCAVSLPVARPACHPAAEASEIGGPPRRAESVPLGGSSPAGAAGLEKSAFPSSFLYDNEDETVNPTSKSVLGGCRWCSDAPEVEVL